MVHNSYSKEDFGYLVVFPDGTIDLYSPEAAPYLQRDVSQKTLAKYRLSELIINPDFHLRSPLIVWFEVTRKCNLTCTHCYIDAGRARRNELSFSEVIAVLEDLRRLGTHSVVLAGGEPYARKDFPEILRVACRFRSIADSHSDGSRTAFR